MKDRFLIGAATAAHQVEGNNIHSDCWVSEHLKHSDFKEPSNEAVDHYHHYKEDITLMKQAGLNAYRFSIEWARIEPEEGKFCDEEMKHYEEVIDYCLENDIEPIITLHHFSSPAWLISKGGWKAKETSDRFAEYVKYVIKHIGDKVHYVCTINEANMGYQLNKIAADMMKSRKKGKEGDVQVGVNNDVKNVLLSMFEQARAFHCRLFHVNTFLNPRSLQEEKIVMEAHQKAKKVIKEKYPDIRVGLSLSLFDYQPEEDGKETAAQLWKEDFGNYFPYIEDDDFLGVQNYSRKIVNANGPVTPGSRTKLTQMGYEYYPSSIGHVVEKVAKEFKGELLITENGVATDKDEDRCAFIEEALTSVRQAKEKGVPVVGYMHWSLLDNFEWQAGYEKTFGLIAVDRKTMKRHAKNSLYTLGRITKEMK